MSGTQHTEAQSYAKARHERLNTPSCGGRGRCPGHSPAGAGAGEALEHRYLLAVHHAGFLAVCQLHAVLAELAVPPDWQVLLWGARLKGARG